MLSILLVLVTVVDLNKTLNIKKTLNTVAK